MGELGKLSFVVLKLGKVIFGVVKIELGKLECWGSYYCVMSMLFISHTLTITEGQQKRIADCKWEVKICLSYCNQAWREIPVAAVSPWRNPILVIPRNA